jgi:hypothetical protein
VSWLKKSLRTKDLREANIKAKPVLMEFDGILARAESLLRAVPLQTHLSEREIERMADYQFASMLEEDEEVRRDGTGSEALFQAIARQLQEAGAASPPQFLLNTKPVYGLSAREMLKIREGVEGPPAKGRDALARGTSPLLVRSYLSCSMLSASTWTATVGHTVGSAWLS